MIASGSTDGSDTCTSLVATNFMQSVEPGSGTSSTLMPSFSNQPIFCAMANGAAAELTVLAHQPTRTVRTSASAGAVAIARPSASAAAATICFITTRLLCLPVVYRYHASGP